MNLTPEECITKCCIDMQRVYPFFGYFLLFIKKNKTTCPDPNDKNYIPTMGINEYGKLFYNFDFVEALNMNELTAVLCHEILHVATGTFQRRKDRDFTLWNIASDIVINYMLVLNDITLPTSINVKGHDEPVKPLIPNRNGDIEVCDVTINAKSKTSEEIYDELYNALDKNNKINYVFDVHLEDKAENGEKFSQENGARSINERDWQKRLMEANIVSSTRGKSLNGLDALIKDIFRPQLDWKSRIRKFVTNYLPYDWSNVKPGRKFYSNKIWLPSLLKEEINVFVSVDMSGSTFDIMQLFFNELGGIISSYNNLNVKIFFWDVEVHKIITVTTNNVSVLKDIKIDNVGGGTVFSCYAEYLKLANLNSNCHIVLTDGYIEDNPIVPKGNILFVMPHERSSKDIVKKYGEVAYIKNVSKK